LPGASWSEFFAVEDNAGECIARLPVLEAALRAHRSHYPAIRESGWVARDGHVYMEIPLDAGLPVEVLKSLIDEAYALVWNKLDAQGRMKVQLAGLPYDEPKLMDRLIEMHNLQNHRRELRKIARPGILLRTTKATEARIALGATKIGGRPDLPPKTAWPAYQDGKPLAFLAQIHLAEVAKLGVPIKGLSSEGLLSVFSAWGWLDPDSSDPRTPEDGNEDQSGWTVALLTPPRVKLERFRTPRGLNSFKAAAVELTPILSLPNHRAEPPLAALAWTDDDYKRFDEMQSDYRAVQMGHWLKDRNPFVSHHLLGGYALFQQEFPPELLDKGLAMLLQIGSDGNTAMNWGDGGELTFYTDAKAMAKGRLERIWGECQCG